jgi:D-arabinose 1-dehydrogenase-like Zn-dependent alcohol dehydrogenase
VRPGGIIFPLTVSFTPSPIPLIQLIAGGISIQGSLSCPRSEFPKMLDFAVHHNIRPVIMKWPMNEKGIEDAMTTLREGRMRYRGVVVVE